MTIPYRTVMTKWGPMAFNHAVGFYAAFLALDYLKDGMPYAEASSRADREARQLCKVLPDG